MTDGAGAAEPPTGGGRRIKLRRPASVRGRGGRGRRGRGGLSGRTGGSGRHRRPGQTATRWLLVALSILLVVWVALSLRAGAPDTPQAQVPASPDGSISTGDPNPTPTAKNTPSPFNRQRAMLIQVRNDGGSGVDNMVAGVGGEFPQAQLLAPSRLIVDVPASGQQTLARTATLLDRRASEETLRNLLAVRVEFTLSMGRLALAGMVDYVGGIRVEVDRAITTRDPATGHARVVVPEGTVRLNGTQAATYALAWLPGEPESARLGRFASVVTEAVRGLPHDQLRVAQMLTSLGGTSRTTAPSALVAAFLVQMHSQLIVTEPVRAVLPRLQPGEDEVLPLVRVDLPAAGSLVEEMFPEAALPAAEAEPRILIRNGAGVATASARARNGLVAVGMVPVNGGNADQLDQATTTITLASDADPALGAQIVAALGLTGSSAHVGTAPPSQVSTDPDAVLPPDAIVELGADMVPRA